MGGDGTTLQKDFKVSVSGFSPHLAAVLTVEAATIGCAFPPRNGL